MKRSLSQRHIGKKSKQSGSLVNTAIMAGRYLKLTNGAGHHGFSFLRPKVLFLIMLVVTTTTVVFIELARTRPFGVARARHRESDKEPILFGKARKGGPLVKWGEEKAAALLAGGAVQPKKHTVHKEIENAGMDDFWAVGYGDAETDLEGGDALTVAEGKRYLPPGNVSLPVLFGWERLVGSPRVEVIEGRVVCWQLPPLQPTKVILLAQGRNEQADSWWRQSDECPACSGAPPAVAIVEAALKQGFAVITLDNGHWSREIPYNKNELTWDNAWPLEKNTDVNPTALILDTWLAREGLSSLPLVCLGFSGGARLCSMLSHVAPIAAQALYVHPANGRALRRHPRIEEGEYPPSLYVHMPRHHEHNALLKRAMEALTSLNRTVGLLELYPQRVTEIWLQNQMGDHLSKNETQQLHEAMVKQKWLDEDNFLECPNALAKKPGYEKLFIAAKITVTRTVASHLLRVLRQAYALQEVSSDRISDVLDWLGDECRLGDGLRTGSRCTEIINETPADADTLVFKHELPC